MSSHFDGGQFFQGQGLFLVVSMTQKPRLKLESQNLLPVRDHLSTCQPE